MAAEVLPCVGMSYFCDNHACACHVELDGEANVMRFKAHNGNTVEVRRFKVVVPQDEKTLHFCSVCINVVQLINNK